MKLKNSLIVVEDIKASKQFYEELFGLKVILDFGENIMLSGGLCLQSADSWSDATGTAISYGGNDAALYFEENDLKSFIGKLDKYGVIYVNPLMTRSQEQQVLRIYDPDNHIIEIAESMEAVCRRLLAQGLSIEEAASRSKLPLRFVESCLTEDQ